MYHLIIYFICGIKWYDYIFIIIWKSCLCLDIKAIISLISCPNIYEVMVIINLYVYSNKLHRLSQIICQKVKIPHCVFQKLDDYKEAWLMSGHVLWWVHMMQVLVPYSWNSYSTVMIYWERITWNNLLKYVYIAYLWYAWINSTSSNSSLS